jgi:hypothetical protein
MVHCIIVVRCIVAIAPTVLVPVGTVLAITGHGLIRLRRVYPQAYPWWEIPQVDGAYSGSVELELDEFLDDDYDPSDHAAKKKDRRRKTRLLLASVTDCGQAE